MKLNGFIRMKGVCKDSLFEVLVNGLTKYRFEEDFYLIRGY